MADNLKNLVFAEGEIYRTFNLKLDNIALNNTHIKFEDVEVDDAFETDTEGIPVKVQARRFFFSEETIRGLLYKVLEATEQLEELEDVIHSGNLISPPEGYRFGGGMDLIIDFQKK